METESLPKFRILIVEDSPFSAKVLQDLIDRFPWYSEKETTVYTNAEDAMGHLEKVTVKDFLPNLIILDWVLPGGSGLDFLKKIKSNPLWKDIPVIVNSSSEQKEDISEAYKAGGVVFLRKSKDEGAFNEVIQQLKIRGILKMPAGKESAKAGVWAGEKKKRILVVDDSTLACTSTSEMLTAAGFEVECASGALEAIHAAHRQPFDLILLDIIMPVIDGIEACRRIKADEKLREIPIIMVTIAEESEHLEKAFQAGAMDYITKPTRRFELLTRLNSALALKAKENELAAKNRQLEAALQEITLLQGCLPVCSWCRKIRNMKGAWQQIEEYLRTHTMIRFSHGICEECLKENQQKLSG